MPPPGAPQNCKPSPKTPILWVEESAKADRKDQTKNKGAETKPEKTTMKEA